MKGYFAEKENGYQETIRKGISAIRGPLSNLSYGKGSREDNIAALQRAFDVVRPVFFRDVEFQHVADTE